MEKVIHWKNTAGGVSAPRKKSLLKEVIQSLKSESGGEAGLREKRGCSMRQLSIQIEERRPDAEGEGGGNFRARRHRGRGEKSTRSKELTSLIKEKRLKGGEEGPCGAKGKEHSPLSMTRKGSDLDLPETAIKRERRFLEGKGKT